MMTNDETIYKTAISDGMPEPLALLLVAQARHETGDYSHRFFTIGKNAFGYAYVHGAKWQLDEPGPVADNRRHIAQYRDIADSVHEITDWLRRRVKEREFPPLNSITNPGQYAALLKKSGYYGGELMAYADRLEYWLKEIGKSLINATGTTGITPILFISIILFLFRKNIFGK